LTWPLLDLWRRANCTDRIYLVYFAGGGVVVVLLRDRVPAWPAFLELHLVCLAVVVVLVLGVHRFSIAHAWYPLVMPLVTFPEVARLNLLFVDSWRDQDLLAFENWLFREPPTIWLGRFTSPVVSEPLQIGYLSYFVLLIVVASVLYRRRDRAPFFGVVSASVLSYMVCYIVFVTFPTEGPAHTLRHLYTQPIPDGPFHWMVTVVQRAGVHGNAFPSAHVAGAMVPLVFAWRHARPLGALLTPLVVLLCVGTVYDRYHYVSDVCAGIVLGGAAAWVIMLAQASPAWAARLNIVPARSVQEGSE
jgi:membrane-associated phospholipid phosphatase